VLTRLQIDKSFAPLSPRDHFSHFPFFSVCRLDGMAGARDRRPLTIAGFYFQFDATVRESFVRYIDCYATWLGSTCIQLHLLLWSCHAARTPKVHFTLSGPFARCQSYIPPLSANQKLQAARERSILISLRGRNKPLVRSTTNSLQMANALFHCTVECAFACGTVKKGQLFVDHMCVLSCSGVKSIAPDALN
jgi:hypothetical protein